MESILDPFGRQKSSKFRPRCLSKPHLLQKHDFHENIEKPMEFDDFSAQDGPENGPKLVQDWPKTVPKPLIFHVEFWLQFWTVLGSDLGPFWEPFGPQDRSKIGPKIAQNLSCSNLPPGDRSQRLQDRPKRSQDRPRTAPRGPKTASRGPQKAPRRSKTAPRPPQEAPRETQDRPKPF